MGKRAIRSSHRGPVVARARGLALLIVLSLLHAWPARAQSPAETERALPPYLSDRGTGIPTSLFGTYVREREWLIYPFYEFTKNGEEEYRPSELGFVGDDEFLGTSREHEVLLFIGYGLSDRMALELEGALHASAELEKAPDDPSALPERLEESGLGDVEAQVRWRWTEEAESRPELFSFFEVGFPLQKDKFLIGVQDWEFALGLGAIKGFRWGTLTGRLSIAYEALEGEFEVGEYAVEYLKRVSPRWRYVAALEGEEDEAELILEAQLHFNDHTFLKLNSGFGVTSKAADVAPEVGVVFSFRQRGRRRFPLEMGPALRVRACSVQAAPMLGLRIRPKDSRPASPLNQWGGARDPPPNARDSRQNHTEETRCTEQEFGSPPRQLPCSAGRLPRTFGPPSCPRPRSTSRSTPPTETRVFRSSSTAKAGTA